MAGRQRIVLPYGKDLAIKLCRRSRHAVALYQVLRATRATDPFEIPQLATAKHLGMSIAKLREAIKILVEVGLLRVKGRRARKREKAGPILYSFGMISFFVPFPSGSHPTPQDLSCYIHFSFERCLAALADGAAA